MVFQPKENQGMLTSDLSTADSDFAGPGPQYGNLSIYGNFDRTNDSG